jgi:hypothetical protein
MNNDEARFYLAAFIDGEGHIGAHRLKSGFYTRTVAFANTDRQLLDVVLAVAEQLGFRFVFHKVCASENGPRGRRGRVGWSDRWDAKLAGGRAAFERFREIVPIQSSRKRETLDRLIASYAKLEETIEKRRKRINRVCPTCEQQFWVWPSIIARGDGIFCSVGCGARNRAKARVVLSCQGCREPYFVKSSQRDRSKFCSARCRNLAQGDRMRALAHTGAAARWNHQKD